MGGEGRFGTVARTCLTSLQIPPSGGSLPYPFPYPSLWWIPALPLPRSHPLVSCPTLQSTSVHPRALGVIQAGSRRDPGGIQAGSRRDLGGIHPHLALLSTSTSFAPTPRAYGSNRAVSADACRGESDTAARIAWCGVWRVACGVWRVAWGVWRVACGVWCVAWCVASYMRAWSMMARGRWLRRCDGADAQNSALRSYRSKGAVVHSAARASLV